MQSNGSACDTSSEVQKTSGGNVDGLVTELKSEVGLANTVTTLGLIASNQASIASMNNNNNTICNNNNEYQQSLRSSTSPPAQQQTMTAAVDHVNFGNQPMVSSVANVANTTTTTTTNANVHSHHHQHVSHGYHNSNQRHGHSYHNPQQYHHQHNKYHNNFRGDNESNINHVLLITVINPHSTITCNVIHQICSPYGKVNRIVIFKKNGVQAMVEFDSVESAKQAKSMLHGCDMYTGCCTLRIEFAKPTRLNIHKNDNDSFDYTNPNLSLDESQESAGGSVGGVDSGSNLNENTHFQSGHSMQHHSLHQSHGGHHHNTRGGMTNSRSSGAGGHFQHHNSHSTSHHGQAPPIVGAQPVGSSAPSGNSGVYGIGSPLDQSGTGAGDSFHHENVGFPRSGGGSGNDVPSAYVGTSDSYIQGSHASGAHGNQLYSSRHDSHHHHHHQHSRATNLGGSHSSSFSSANASNAIMHGHNFGPIQGTVMMVYGLHPERINCDRLFNLFCLYGNVSRIKFLRTKEGCAMVQMGDVHAVDRCVNALNKITMFGGELQISYSKQVFLHDVIQPFILPDGSLSFKDFLINKNNRFKNPEVASKNRILPPSQVLHFFNAPYGITEDELIHLFKQTAGHEPVTIKIFIPKADNSKSFSGLATFKDVAEATEALVMCNHLSMPKPGAPNPYILRLCFSSPSHMRQPPPPPYAASNN